MAMSKTKLLFVIERLDAGGAEKALINLLHYMDYDRYEVDLQLFFNMGINLKYLPKQVNLLPPLIDDELVTGRAKLKKDIKELRVGYLIKKAWYMTMAKLICRGGERQGKLMRWKCEINDLKKKNTKLYDTAIGYMHNNATYYVHDCVRARRKLCWFHNEYSDRLRCDMEEKYFKDFYRVVTISPVCVEALKRYFPNLNNIELLYNLNCPELIYKLAEESYPQEFKGVTVPKILSIGRLHYQKGFDIAIDAAARLKSRGTEFKWYILGDGALKAELETKIAENGLQDCFILLGIRDNPYVYMKNADIIAQTSRYEGKSVVIDEAKILGKPIVCTNYASVSDQLTDGLNAVLTTIDAKGIAEGISAMLSDTELRDKTVSYSLAHREDERGKVEGHYRLFDVGG